MEYFGKLIMSIVDFMKIEFSVFGYTISYWQVFLFTMVGGILGWFIGEMLNGD